MRRCWASGLLWPVVRGPAVAEVGNGTVRVRLGRLGRADIPADRVARLSRMRWPWWGGIGARLGRGLVAFATAWGEAALIELDEPIDVRAPLRWSTRRIIVGVEDVDGFLRAVARERAGLLPAGE